MHCTRDAPCAMHHARCTPRGDATACAMQHTSHRGQGVCVRVRPRQGCFVFMLHSAPACTQPAAAHTAHAQRTHHCASVAVRDSPSYSNEERGVPSSAAPPAASPSPGLARTRRSPESATGRRPASARAVAAAARSSCAGAPRRCGHIHCLKKLTSTTAGLFG